MFVARVSLYKVVLRSNMIMDVVTGYLYFEP